LVAREIFHKLWWESLNFLDFFPTQNFSKYHTLTQDFWLGSYVH
jgi:hypothetical protein